MQYQLHGQVQSIEERGARGGRWNGGRVLTGQGTSVLTIMG